MNPVETAQYLVQALEKLQFKPPVVHVYNPLDYARKPHYRYIELYGMKPREVLFMGMNPGPWGMAQTGVPFGEVSMVRDWLRVNGVVEKPAKEHPKRPITGFECHRSEVSGRRLWGWAKDRFGTPNRFFERFFVVNYCPLSFIEESGRNFTPDKLPASERESLFRICDDGLVKLAEHFQPKHVVGVGAFAEKRAAIALEHLDIAVSRMPHPSPASPAANKDWPKLAEDALSKAGIL